MYLWFVILLIFWLLNLEWLVIENTRRNVLFISFCSKHKRELKLMLFLSNACFRTTSSSLKKEVENLVRGKIRDGNWFRRVFEWADELLWSGLIAHWYSPAINSAFRRSEISRLLKKRAQKDLLGSRMSFKRWVQINS